MISFNICLPVNINTENKCGWYKNYGQRANTLDAEFLLIKGFVAHTIRQVKLASF